MARPRRPLRGPGLACGAGGPSGKASSAAAEVDGALLLPRALLLLVSLGILVGGPQEAFAASGGGDFFDPVVNLNVQIIEGIDGIVGSAGVAIIVYTLLVKLVTAPLNQMSMRTNVILQALQPQTSEIQRRYEAEEIAPSTSANLLNALYGEFKVSPITGLLLPVVVQLPVLVSLFRAISRLSEQDSHFKEGFLWIPSLAGPASFGGASLDWLLKTRYADHFEPLIGWPDASMYLIMPVLLIAVQILSTSIVPPPSNQGWVTYLFSAFLGISALVTPQGVGLYWLVNTGWTAAQTSFVKGQVYDEFPKLMKAAEKAANDSDGIRYTRKSEFRDESAASKAVNKLAADVQPSTPKPRSRPAKRSAAMKERRKSSRPRRR